MLEFSLDLYRLKHRDFMICFSVTPMPTARIDPTSVFSGFLIFDGIRIRQETISRGSETASRKIDDARPIHDSSNSHSLMNGNYVYCLSIMCITTTKWEGAAIAHTFLYINMKISCFIFDHCIEFGHVVSGTNYKANESSKSRNAQMHQTHLINKAFGWQTAQTLHHSLFCYNILFSHPILPLILLPFRSATTRFRAYFANNTKWMSFTGKLRAIFASQEVRNQLKSESKSKICNRYATIECAQ